LNCGPKSSEVAMEASALVTDLVPWRTVPVDVSLADVGGVAPPSVEPGPEQVNATLP
jgi:hypothetical protein